MNIKFKNTERSEIQLNEGRYNAVVTGVFQIGSNKYNQQPLDSLMIEFSILGEDHEIVDKTYEIFISDMAPNSKLCRFLESWRGRPFTSIELKDFDISKIIMKPLTIHLQKKIGSKGTSYFTSSEPEALEIDSSDIDQLVTIQYDFETNGFSQQELSKLPKVPLQFIQSSVEYEDYEKSSRQSNYVSSRKDARTSLITEEPF